MQRLVCKELPAHDCLVEAAKQFPDLDPSACEAFLTLMRAGDDIWRVMNAHFASHNITQGRFLVMMLLLEKGTDCPAMTTPAELAEHASVSRATITGLLDTLERDGLVNRQPDPKDRRQMSVKLTQKGQDTMHAILPGHFRVMNTLTASLSETERKTLTRLLTKISLQAAAADSGFAVITPDAAQANSGTASNVTTISASNPVTSALSADATAASA